MWEEFWLDIVSLDLNLFNVYWFYYVGRNIKAHAESDSEAPVDPPKVEEKIGAVPSGLSTDSDVTKRLVAVLRTRCLIRMCWRV